MAKPVISIIIPTKNEAANIVRCLESIKSQDFPSASIETILVDDSSDATIFQAGRFPVKIYRGRHERSAQRNLGARRARGRFLLFLDADMALSPRVVTQTVHLLKNPYTIVSIPEIGVGRTFWEKVLAFERQFYYLETSIHAARAFSASVFRQLHGFDEQMYASEDWDLTLRSYRAGYQLLTTPAPLYHHERATTLHQALAKERYYLNNIHIFAAKHPAEFAKFSSPTHRSWLYLKHFPLLLRHPILSLCLVYYKLRVYKLSRHSMRQPQTAKLGEISYRTRLTTQHLGRANPFSSELTATEMLTFLKGRIAKRRQDFKAFPPKILRRPILEIGSGYGETALLLKNEFNLPVLATDLAPQPLKSIPKTAKKLGYTKLPRIRICDAEALPFPDNSFNFVFCYQTLHHFPHPQPVLDEVYRVLRPGGYFYFGEEPISQIINLNLWRRPNKLRWWEKPLKYTGILHFISRIGKSETDQGILENTFSLGTWRLSLTRFKIIQSTLTPFPLGPASALNRRNFLNRLMIYIMGGGISVLCTKT